MRPSALRRPTLLLALLAAACDSPSDGNRDPEAVAIVSGDLQTATVGQALGQDFVVRVTDGRDRPVEGAAVSFVVTAGGGTLSAASASTDAAGTARTRLTLGTIAGDTQRVEARVTGEDGPVTAAFRAVGTAAAPSAVAAQGSANVTGPAGAAVDSLTVRVTDAFGNPTSGVAVVFSVVSGGGTISPTTATTNAAGLAKASWTLGLRVDSLQRAEAAISPATRVQFTATPTLPLGVVVHRDDGDLQADSVGSTLPTVLRASVTTAAGVPIPGAPVTWTTTSGTMAPPTSTTDFTGQASATWTLGTVAGAQTATATATGTAASATFTATVRPGRSAALSIVSGNNQTGETYDRLADSLVVEVRDRFGNLVRQGSGPAFSVVSGGGSLTPDLVSTDAQGHAFVRWFLGPPAGEQRVRATATTGASVDFVATATGVPIAILNPAPNRRTGDTVQVWTEIPSTFPLDSAYARIADRQVNLVPSSGQRRGTLLLFGLPSGTYWLVVRARDANGSTGADSIQVLLDRRPTLTVSAPPPNAVATPSIRVTATCVDDFPGCAVTLRNPHVTGTGTLDQTVSLAANDRSLVRLEIDATDSGVRTVSTTRSVYVQSSPLWDEIFQLGFAALDASPAFVVARDSVPTDTLYLRDVTSGNTYTLAVDNPRGVAVTSYGAVYGFNGSIYDWRGGAPTSLGTAGISGQPCGVEGRYVAWIYAGGIRRTDLSTGTTIEISTSGPVHCDVAANGDVAWTNGTEAYWRHESSGSIDILPRTAGWFNQNPLTDGTQVVYTTRPPTGPLAPRPQIVVYRDPATTWAFDAPTTAEPSRDRDYDANGGWAAVRTTPAGESLGVLTLAPDGTLRRATPGASLPSAGRLGSDGTLLYFSGGQGWVIRAPYTGTPVYINNQFVSGYRWHGTTLVATLGRGAFEIDY